MQTILETLGQYYFQTAYVVRDINAAEKWFTNTLGVPLWARSDVELGESCRYRGGPSDSAMTISLGFAGEVQIELIQPKRGKSIYTEFLDQGHGGLHHIAFVVPHYDEVVDSLKKAGCEPLAEGSLTGGSTRFAYFDCSSHDASVVEILDFSAETIAAMNNLKQQCKQMLESKDVQQV